MATEGVSVGLGLGLSCLLLAILGRAIWRLRGTTLVAPCGWALLTTLGLAGNLGWVAGCEPSEAALQLSALQFAMATLSLCPLMGVLGAKRPQDRGWQWVVLSLWIIVSGPAVQAVLLPRGIRVEVFLVWKLFLVGLISLGLLNYLPTRNALPSVLVALGQVILFDPYLADWKFLPNEWALTVGIACFTSGAVWAYIACGSKQSASDVLESLSHQWLSFRDSFGAFWAIRILGRINQTLELQASPIRLTWSGFVKNEGDPSEAQLVDLKKQMETLLRRFI